MNLAFIKINYARFTVIILKQKSRIKTTEHSVLPDGNIVPIHAVHDKVI